MNTRLLRTVAKHISEEPRRLDMEHWCDIVDLATPQDPPCGTVGCIAGWACILSGAEPVRCGSQEEFEPRARTLLDLEDDESDRLFTAPKIALEGSREKAWPKNFARRYVKAKTAKGRASATVARIEHFIKTKGKE